MHAGHGEDNEDQLTGIAITEANDQLVTTDTAGRIKMFDCSKIKDWRTETDHASKIKVIYFINAHRSLISSVEMVEKKPETDDAFAFDASSDFEGIPDEPYVPWPDRFILTASQDNNILLHRLSNGVLVGQFGQENYWNIYDMTPYDGVMPNFERNWFRQQKENWRNKLQEIVDKARAEGLIKDDELTKVTGRSTVEKLRQLGYNVGGAGAAAMSTATKDDSFE